MSDTRRITRAAVPIETRRLTSPPPRRPPPRGRPSSRWIPLAAALGGLLLLVLVVRQFHQPSAAVVSSSTSARTAVATTAYAASTMATRTLHPQPSSAAVDTSALTAKIAAITRPLQGTYAYWIDDLPTGAITSQEANQQFIAASVIKVYILTALYEESAEGKLSLQEKMTTTADEIQNYGTGSIRYDPVGTTYTLADLAQRAAKQSDNTAAFLLTKRLGQAYIQGRVQSWGMTDTSVADDKTTPADIGTLFEKLAERRLLPAPAALDLLGLLTDTDFEDRLPALLPSYALVAHKIGTEANGVINDAGVVVLPTRSYVIVILTQGTDPNQSILAEQQISRAAFDFESGLP